MRLARREDVQMMDRLCIEEAAIPLRRLIENAGVAMAKEVALWPGLQPSSRIAVVCGPGNNGADGLVVARILQEKGFSRTQVFDYSQTAPVASARPNLPAFDLVIDALFGVGLNRPLEGDWKKLVEAIRGSRLPVISLDVPSGLDANRGIVQGAAVHATWTLTCGLAKPGFFFQEGPVLAGRIKILAVGIPSKIRRRSADSVFLVTSKLVRQLLPQRNATANKSQHGHLLVIGGSKGMEGAALLTATAAGRMGAGYVSLASPDAIPFDIRPPDFLTHSWSALMKGDFGKATAVVLGPGLSNQEDIPRLLLSLEQSGLPAVIDAGALETCARILGQPPMPNRWPKNWVLTPHAGELSRILPRSSREIEDDRLSSAREGQQRTGACVLLKGFHTVVDNGRKAYVIHAGNAALAKAGTGDVLAGFVGGLMAQGLPTDEAAVCGAWMHGRIADVWVRDGFGSGSLMASDLPVLLRYVFDSIS